MGQQVQDALDGEQRLRAVDRVWSSDRHTRERLDTIVRLARTLFDVPVAAVNLVGRDDVRPVASDGLDARALAREEAPCALVVRDDDELVVEDASAHPRLRDLATVSGDPHLRFYAALPIRPLGQTVGTLCMWSTEPRGLSPRDREIFQDLAAWAETEIELDQDASEAREVQRRLLPSAAPDVPGIGIGGRCVPARSIGGDLYDWRVVERPGETSVQVALADVMGKGLPAAITAAGLRAVLRGTARFNSLEAMMLRLSESLLDDPHEESVVAASPSTGPVFATLFAARVHEGGAFEWIDAGHGWACVVDPSGGFRELTAGELPLGIEAASSWTARRDRLEPGEALLVVSDGVLGEHPDLASLAGRLSTLCASSTTAQALVDGIVDLGVLSHGGRPHDDVTALAVVRPREGAI